MKKVLFLSLLVFSTQSFALDQTCISHIENLEKKLENCTVEYQDNATTSEMNNAVYASADCAQKVAHELFDVYYASTSAQSKELYDALVQQIYMHAHHLNQDSDYAKKYHTGTMYNSIAIAEAEEMVKTLTKGYLKQSKSECQEFLDKE